MTFHCTDSFEYEDWSMKHPNLENKAPKNSKPEIDFPFVVVEILYDF